jgi:hypothetical protein
MVTIGIVYKGDWGICGTGICTVAKGAQILSDFKDLRPGALRWPLNC